MFAEGKHLGSKSPKAALFLIKSRKATFSLIFAISKYITRLEKADITILSPVNLNSSHNLPSQIPGFAVFVNSPKYPKLHFVPDLSGFYGKNAHFHQI